MCEVKIQDSRCQTQDREYRTPDPGTRRTQHRAKWTWTCGGEGDEAKEPGNFSVQVFGLMNIDILRAKKKCYWGVLVGKQREKVDNGSTEKARMFIEQSRQCKEEKFKSVGHGWDHRFEGSTIVGSALVHQEKVIHMAFFGITESEKVGKMSSASRRRNFRMQ